MRNEASVEGVGEVISRMRHPFADAVIAATGAESLGRGIPLSKDSGRVYLSGVMGE